MTGKNLLSWAATWTVEAEEVDVSLETGLLDGEESKQHHQALFPNFVSTALASWFILYRRLHRRLLTDALWPLFQILVRKLPDGRELWGRIVETEAYLGGEDEASHSKGGKQTQRNAAMFMKPGTLYVYQIYGIYFCVNVSSQGKLRPQEI